MKTKTKNQNKDTHHTLDYLQNEQGLVCAQCRGWSIKLPLHKTFLQCAHMLPHIVRGHCKGFPCIKLFCNELFCVPNTLDCSGSRQEGGVARNLF